MMTEDATDSPEMKPMSDVATVIAGTSPKGSQINDQGDGIPFYQGAKEFGARHPRPERFTTHPVKSARAGDILLSVRAPVGRVNIADTDCAIGRGVAAVRAKDPSDVEYLAAVLGSLGARWDAHASDGTMFSNLSKAGLSSMSVPWPANRHRIAKVLGAIEVLIESSRTAAQYLEALGDAMFEVALENGATEKSLREVADVVMGNSPPGSSYNEAGNGTLLFQGCAEFGFRFPTPRLSTTAPGRMAEPGDSLISVRAPVGRLNKARVRCCVGRGLAAVRSTEFPSLVYYALRSSEESWSPYDSEGTVFGSINGPALRELKVPIPDYPEQLENQLNVIDEGIFQLTVQAEAAAHLRGFVLPRLLSGDLGVSEITKIEQDEAL